MPQAEPRHGGQPDESIGDAPALDDQHFAIHQLGEVAASGLLGDPTSSSKFACSQSTPVHQRYQHRAASGISDKGGYAGNIGLSS